MTIVAVGASVAYGMRLLVTVLNTLAMAISARITANSRQNTFTTVAIIWLESRCSM